MMKKLLCAAAALLLCLAPALAVCADGELYKNAYELWASWDRTYPDYVAGVWSTDGTVERLTFALVEGAGEKEKEELLSRIEDKDSLSFAEGYRYSYAELRSVQAELTAYLGDGTGAVGIGVYEGENRVHIDINTDNPGAEAFMRMCRETYGEMIVFEGGPGTAFVNTVAAEEAPPLAAEPSVGRSAGYLFPILALCLVLGGLALLKQRGLIFRPAEGPEAAARPTFRRVEAAVRDSAETPDDRLRRAIFERIGKTDG